MNILQSIVLGVIQGITEFFPVSSSGHLVILPYFFGWDYNPLYFTVMVHFATLLAVLSVFYREVFRIVKAVIPGIFRPGMRRQNDFRIGMYIIVASIPAALAGFLLDDYIENLFSKPLIVAFLLLGTALILWLGERRGSRIESHYEKYPDAGPGEPGKDRLLGHINTENGKSSNVRFNLFIAVMAGIGQAIAILPGISRSGATISFARFFGVKRIEAVRFSFLMAIPVILGSFIFEVYRESDILFSGSSIILWELAAGFISAYLSGLLAIRFMLYLTGNRNLNIFALYCVCLSIAVFTVYIFRVR